jgi:hypothetical protein
MTPDRAAIIRGVEAEIPDVTWEELAVTWPADDDGLWFFRVPGGSYEAQIESSEGVCPFLIETDRHNDRHFGDTVDDVVDTIVCWLRAQVSGPCRAREMPGPLACLPSVG